jgi:hypothetical protein
VEPADTTLYASPWPQIERWDRQLVAAEQRVYGETGIWVPSDAVKSIEEIESGGAWPSPVSPQGYVGLMQVGPGSYGTYDLARVQSDPGYSLYAGISDLALRRRESGFLPWRNVAVGYFSGHYNPTGATDALGTSDQDYLDQFDRNEALMRPGADGGLPDPTHLGFDVGDTAAAASHWGGRIGLFLLAGALLAAGLWALKGAG